MSDGLNLFDESASAVGGFPVVLRGYDRGPVDAYIADLERDLRAARDEIRDLRHQADVSAARHGDTDFTRLGAHATALLSAAERQAAELLAQAGLDADRLRSSAAADATQRRELAEAEAVRTREDGLAALKSLRVDAEEQAAGQLATARSGAAQLLEAAQHNAEAVRDEAEQAADEIRQAARLEAERIVAEAEEKAAELRTASIAEQNRALARLRLRHEEATAQTRALVERARQAQAESSERLTKEAQHAAAARAKAIADAEQIRHLAHKAAAEQALADQREAAARAERLERNLEARRATLEREVTILETRKRAVVAQLDALGRIAREGGRQFVDPDEVQQAASLAREAASPSPEGAHHEDGPGETGRPAEGRPASPARNEAFEPTVVIPTDGARHHG